MRTTRSWCQVSNNFSNMTLLIFFVTANRSSSLPPNEISKSLTCSHSACAASGPQPSFPYRPLPWTPRHPPRTGPPPTTTPCPPGKREVVPRIGRLANFPIHATEPVSLFLLLECRILRQNARFRSPDHGGKVDRHLGLVWQGKAALPIELLVQASAHTPVCAIGTNDDRAGVGMLVGAVDRSPVRVLGD